MELKLIWSYSIDYTILKLEIVVIYRHNFLYLSRQYLEILNQSPLTLLWPMCKNGMMQFLCTCTVWFCRKVLESVGHMSPVLALSLTRAFQFFFIFTILGEVRAWSSTLNTCLNSYLFTVHCSMHRLGHASQNTNDFDIWSWPLPIPSYYFIYDQNKHVIRQVVCRAKAAKLWRACSHDFTRFTVYLVVQMDFYVERQFIVGSLLFTGLLNADNVASRLANHVIIHKPSLTSKI